MKGIWGARTCLSENEKLLISEWSPEEWVHGSLPLENVASKLSSTVYLITSRKEKLKYWFSFFSFRFPISRLWRNIAGILGVLYIILIVSTLLSNCKESRKQPGITYVEWFAIKNECHDWMRAAVTGRMYLRWLPLPWLIKSFCEWHKGIWDEPLSPPFIGSFCEWQKGVQDGHLLPTIDQSCWNWWQRDPRWVTLLVLTGRCCNWQKGVQDRLLLPPLMELRNWRQ